MAIAPPRPKGPPLNALRAFEAAARLGGFAAAAVELSVTPGAVAQHVKTLEAWIGADLFERRSQGVVLTALGAAVAGDLGSAFDRLGEAVIKMRRLAPGPEIRIATLPSVAQLWLSPRLPRIRQAVPEATVSVIATEQPPNTLREPIDLTLFFEDEADRPNAVVVARDTIFPVCAPSIAERIETVDDLAGMQFLHDTSWADDWTVWLEAEGRAGQFETTGPAFSLYALAVEEAKAGGGVLIGHEPLVRPLLDAGTLVAPFDRRVALDRPLLLSSAARPPRGSALERLIGAMCAG